MKRIITSIVIGLGFVISCWSQITEAEYFIDTDPGIGSATSLAVTSGNTITENFAIPTAGLTTGLHVLHIRVKGTNNIWSLYYRDYFYIQTVVTPPTASNITEAEYFIDADPGVGSGLPLAITPGQTIDETFAIPTTSLSSGLHVLHIRVKDADDTWSLFYRDYFYIQTVMTPPMAPDITAAEYFFDTDPGVGSGLPIPVTAGQTINETFAIPSTGLSSGLHVLHIRVKDADDTWSLFYRDYFYIQTVSNITATPITEAEYFFDTDPGVGSATAIAVTEGFTVNETLAIPVPTDMSNGNHYLHLRVKDQDNTWSLYKFALFEVDDTLTIEDFESDSFSVFPNPTNTILHLNFKRSSNHTIQVFDVNGKELLNIQTNQLDNTLNFSNYAKGIYVLRLVDNTSLQSRTLKIIKS